MSAIELAGDFLAEGTIVATVVDGDGDEVVYRSRSPRPYTFPVVLLVDRHTASAAEVFAGSLSAHGRAIVIGERTYGKGSAQTLVAGELGPRYATIATVTRPDGEPLQGRGVEPDVVIADPSPPPTAADFTAGWEAALAADPALRASIDAVQGSA